MSSKTLQDIHDGSIYLVDFITCRDFIAHKPHMGISPHQFPFTPTGRDK